MRRDYSYSEVTECFKTIHCELCRRLLVLRHKDKEKKKYENPEARKLRNQARKKKHDVRKKYGKLCYICHKRKADTIDHVVPITRGGISNIENLRPACFQCNSAKGSRTLVEFLLMIG